MIQLRNYFVFVQLFYCLRCFSAHVCVLILIYSCSIGDMQGVFYGALVYSFEEHKILVGIIIISFGGKCIPCLTSFSVELWEAKAGAWESRFKGIVKPSSDGSCWSANLNFSFLFHSVPKEHPCLLREIGNGLGQCIFVLRNGLCFWAPGLPETQTHLAQAYPSHQRKTGSPPILWVENIEGPLCILFVCGKQRCDGVLMTRHSDRYPGSYSHGVF